MLLRRPEFLILLLSASALILAIKLIDRLNSGENDSSGSRTNKVRLFEKNRIYYLKDPNCPWDALQNILMRFGYLRGLDFTLPGWRTSEQSHIFIQQTKFNYSQQQYSLHPGTLRITALSNPEFESIEHQQVDPTNHSHFRLFSGGNLTWNPLARRLGYDFPTFDSGHMGKFLDRLDAEFDLVLISEHLEVSLVLLCRLLDWPLENVIFLARETANEAKLVLTGTEPRGIEAINDVDLEIYSHFLNKLRQLVLSYGQNRMIHDVSALMSLNHRFARACSIISKCRGTLENDKVLQCTLAEIDEPGFTDLIRGEQIRRAGVIKRLRVLLGAE